MSWIEMMQRSVQYIEEHLLEDIKIDLIAEQAHASPFHFQRVFSILTDMTVGDYVRRRRLTLAAQELMTTDAKIIDIALRYGYETPEAFAKAFRKQHGASPSDVRSRGGKLKSYNRLTIQVSLKGAEPMNYRIEEHEGFQVTGMKKSFSMQNGENVIGIPLFWQEFNSSGQDEELIKMNNGKIKGLLGVCAEICVENGQTFDYWIGTAHEGNNTGAYQTINIPASRWAIFEVCGAMPDAIQSVWKQIHSEWFPSHPYEHAGTPDFELYFEGDPASADYRSEIWIPIK